MISPAKPKSSLRIKADEAKRHRCKNLIVVLENPGDFLNIGPVIRNVNALGAEKTYIVDGKNTLPDDWQEMRHWRKLVKTSASAVKWSFVKRYSTTEECFDYLEKKHFRSILTSPHIKGKECVDLSDGDYTKYTKLAVWFGSEAHGISDEVIERSELCVNIPMHGIVESLNLGVSTGIVLYEITKQRREFIARKYGAQDT